MPNTIITRAGISGFSFMWLLLLFFIPAGIEASVFTSSSAEDSSIQASASVNSSRLFVGERFILTVEVTGPRLQNVQRPTLPTNLEGVAVLSATPSSTSSFSVINGVSTASNGFRFTMQAQQEGQFTIPPIQIRVDGVTYTTQELTLNILSRSQMQASGQQEDVYLELQLSNERPYAGEQITAKVVLFYKNDISVISYQPSSSWNTQGFWLERLTDAQAPRAETVIINGVQYRRAELLTYALFPTRSGRVSLGEHGITVNVRPTSRYGDAARFFDGFGRAQRSVDLVTQSVELQVQSLPEPQPIGFTGAVGQFRVERNVPNPKVTIGEPLEIETRFTGSGNVALIGQPQYDFPGGFENFRPIEDTDITKSPRGISGSRTFTDVLIARRVGNYTLPATRVYWFNPARQRYESADFAKVELAVLRDESQEFLHVDDPGIRVSPATGLARWFVQEQPSLVGKLWFRFLLVFPFFLLGGAWLRKRYRDRLKNDHAFSRSEAAYSKAEEKLGAAHLLAAEAKYRDAYGMLHKALSGYISDRLNLPETGISDTYLISAVRETKVDHTLINRMDKLFSKLSGINYAPGGGRTNYKADHAECEQIIENIKGLKR